MLYLREGQDSASAAALWEDASAAASGSIMSRILAEQARAASWRSSPALPADGTKYLRGAKASAEEWKSEVASAARRLVRDEKWAVVVFARRLHRE